MCELFLIRHCVNRRSQAKWLPKGDGNRNLEKVNAVMNLSTELERFRTSV
jgi:hypothetical protein